MWTLKFVFPAVCLESCPLLAGYNLLSKAHMQNIQNISEITQKSKLYQGLCCPSQAWLEAEFQTEYLDFLPRMWSFLGFFVLHCVLFIQNRDPFVHQLLAQFSMQCDLPTPEKAAASRNSDIPQSSGIVSARYEQIMNQILYLCTRGCLLSANWAFLWAGRANNLSLLWVTPTASGVLSTKSSFRAEFGKKRK